MDLAGKLDKGLCAVHEQQATHAKAELARMQSPFAHMNGTRKEGESREDFKVRLAEAKERARLAEEKVVASTLRATAKKKERAEKKANRWAPEGQEMERTGVSGRNLRMKELRREASERKEGETDEDFAARVAAAKEEISQEKIVFFGRKTPLWQAVVLFIVAKLAELLHDAVPVLELPGIKALSPLKVLKKFLLTKWKYSGASFHGKKLAFHCTFAEFWLFFALELVKSIGTCFVYNIYHTYKNSMLMEHFLDSRLGWADHTWDPDAVDPQQTDFVIFRTEGAMGCQKKMQKVLETWWGPCQGCCHPDAALYLVEEEINMYVIGGQTFHLEMKATLNASKAPVKDCQYHCFNCCDGTPFCFDSTYCKDCERTNERDPENPGGKRRGYCVGNAHPACCTKFHKMYCMKIWCPPFTGKYNTYIDDHLEWRGGSEHIKQVLLSSGNCGSAKRISQFALAGTPFSAKQRASLAGVDEIDIEMTEVVVVAGAEAQQPEDVPNPMGGPSGGEDAVACPACSAVNDSGATECSACQCPLGKGGGENAVTTIADATETRRPEEDHL